MTDLRKIKLPLKIVPLDRDWPACEPEIVDLNYNHLENHSMLLLQSYWNSYNVMPAWPSLNPHNGSPYSHFTPSFGLNYEAEMVIANWQTLLLQFCSAFLSNSKSCHGLCSLHPPTHPPLYEFYASIRIKTHLDNTLYLSSLWSNLSCATELVIADSKLVPWLGDNNDV